MLEENLTSAPPVAPDNTNAPRMTQSQVFGKSELLDANKILQQILGISAGQVVADLGGGGGMFALESARLAGEQGQVYVVDIMKNTLADIESQARMAGLHNIKTVWSNLEIVGAAKIKDAIADFALLTNVLFQSKKHREILSEAYRLLKTGGLLLIIDWRDTKPGFTPPSELQVDPQNIINQAQQIGYNLIQDFQAGTYHFGLIFVKQ